MENSPRFTCTTKALDVADVNNLDRACCLTITYASNTVA